ncbi:hypothetical protein CEXT_50751 [Caerostris extrusa]|uniref:Uncharacterized protein n=1 Tax=Caerostris extrusa TaxID=172846 RepID=A0AAV4QP20_CAEEX|nr:hypothetical protein CEXT_50751 [Caerostris extrusa]
MPSINQVVLHAESNVRTENKILEIAYLPFTPSEPAYAGTRMLVIKWGFWRHLVGSKNANDPSPVPDLDEI